MTPEMLAKMGRLAHLDVSKRDEAFRRDLARIVHFCRALDARDDVEADDGVSAAAQPTPLRPDVVTEGGDAAAVLSHASRTADGFFVAPRSIERPKAPARARRRPVDDHDLEDEDDAEDDSPRSTSQ